jgi:hypothetical protein
LENAKVTDTDFAIFAEHFQFYVQDKETDNLLTIYWDETSREDLFALSDEIVGIATVRNMEVPVSLTFIEKEPENEDLDDWDHVVQGYLNVPSGKLLVTGPTSQAEDSFNTEVEPGLYGLRAYYGSLDEVDAEGFEGDDYYKIAMWKTDGIPEVQVLKRWTPQPATF